MRKKRIKLDSKVFANLEKNCAETPKKNPPKKGMTSSVNARMGFDSATQQKKNLSNYWTQNFESIPSINALAEH